MTEAGGPATQSGIFFQNTIAVRYLGRLCDPSERPISEQVGRVRVEAPGHVDDVVVTYRDGHRDLISAKERLDPNTDEFGAVWRAFALQYRAADFAAADRLVLVVGTFHGLHDAISNVAARASSSVSHREWRSRCGKKHDTALEKLRLILQPADDNDLWRLLSRVHVEITSLNLVEKHLPDWLPSASIAKHTLVRLLRDRVGGHARVRREFSRDELVRDLRDTDSVEIIGVESDDAVYSQALLRRYDQILVPGTSIAGSAEALYADPLLRVLPSIAENAKGTAFHEQEIYEREGPRVGLEAFDGEAQTIVVAPAGFGKTELIRTLARRHIRAGVLPAVVSLVDAIARDLPLVSYLETIVNGRFACSVDWIAGAEQGRVVLLLDGLDELADHPRSLALRRLKEFSARFPHAGWVLTVRDESALFGVPEATMLALEPWHDDRRLDLVRKFLGPKSESRAEALCKRLGQSTELDRLARVPLFLALLVEESKEAQFGQIPLRRRDLLLRYVERLVRSDSDAEKRPALHTMRSLVEAAERLAIMALEAGAPQISERVGLEGLASSFGTHAESLLADLASCGVVRSTQRQIRFVFPLVQEYLAGRHLQRERSSTQIADLFRRAATRPWAQALRFAVEESPDADAIATALLAGPDDAFNSVTLALGQCVADGAGVANATRNTLAERLGTLWAESAFSEHAALTRVLAAGFSSPLPAAAREAIAGNRRLDQGGGTLLSFAQDDALARAVLQRRPIPFGYKLGDAKPAMSRIADEVVSTCIDWLASSKDRAKTPADAGWIGCIIRDLDGVSNSVRSRIANDERTPSAVRIGALLLGKGDLEPTAGAIVDRALTEVLADSHPTRTYHFELIEEALWRLPAPLADAAWVRWVLDERFLPRWRSLLLSGVVRFRSEADALALLDGLRAPPSLVTAVEVVKAWLGRREAMVALTDRVDELDEYDLRGWSVLVGRYLERDLIMQGVKKLARRSLTAGAYHDVAHKVWFPLVHDVQSPDPLTGAHGRYRRLHPAAHDASLVFLRWGLQTTDDSEGARTLCLMIALDLGNEDAREELVRQVSKPRRAPLTFKEDYALSSAVSILSRSAALPLSVLEPLAKCSDSNLLYSIYRACAKHPSLESLDFLLREDRRVQKHTRGQARQALRTVSVALGVRLEDRAGQLVEV